MNEKRFNELLNLYIDSEASREERDELEHEVAGNPRRRQKFQSYCRLQRASEKVHRDFGDALAETVDLKKYHIVARSSTRCCWRRGLLFSSGALAAACITVVAAVAIFQDAAQGFSSNRAREENFGLVEVFDSGSLNARTEKPRSGFVPDRSEPFTFAGRSSAFSQAKTKAAFLDSPAPGFQTSSNLAGLGDELRTDYRARVFRGQSSFEAGPELMSFQFQR